MDPKPLAGQRVAVFVEHKFIPDEVAAYRAGFASLGADVHFASRLWYGEGKPPSPPQPVTFYSDVDPLDEAPWESPHTLQATHDVQAIAVELDKYAAVIMSANYTSVRLRWDALPKPQLADLTAGDIAGFDARRYVQGAPAVRLFEQAMQRKRLVKGALCHGLWVLTPNPHLLRGRRVICHSVVMADVLNCGAEVTLANSGVVVDDDLVTGFSKHEVISFIAAIADRIIALQGA
jgi:protease I